MYVFYRVDSWASKFGDELNWLAKNMTKADEIKKVNLVDLFYQKALENL